MLFLTKLAAKISQKSKDWRQNTVLLLDGASYHKIQPARQLLDDLGIKVIIFCPYSYSGAHMELFFGYLKRSTWRLKTCERSRGKTSFSFKTLKKIQNLVKLVFKKILAMQRHSFHLFWRGAMLHQF